MDPEATKVEPVTDLTAVSTPAVVSPPPLDVLWHADFELAPWSETALDWADSGRVVTDADALALAESSHDKPSEPRESIGDSLDVVHEIKSEQTPQDEKQARQIALAARRRRVYRAKKKSELEALREMSAVLGDRLAELVARNESLKNQLVQYGKAGRFAAGWRGVALRQLQRRMEAEALNRELRGLVRQHYNVAQALTRTLQSSLCAVEPKRLNALEFPKQQAPKQIVQLHECDVRTAAELLWEIDATYALADDVLRNCQLPPDTEQAYNLRQGWRRDPDSESEFLELVETWTIPFGLEDAVPAMHKSLPIMLSKECHPVIIPGPDSTTTTAIKFVFSGTDGDQRTVCYQSVLVAKVFVEQDHAIFRWRAVTVDTECVGSLGDEIIETGWGLARRAPSASGGHGDPTGTKIEFYTRFEMRDGPMMPRNGARRNKKLEHFVNLMFNDAQDDIIEWYQVIESLVMNDLSALSISQAP